MSQFSEEALNQLKACVEVVESGDKRPSDAVVIGVGGLATDRRALAIVG
jgi:hypothetical protein